MLFLINVIKIRKTYLKLKLLSLCVWSGAGSTSDVNTDDTVSPGGGDTSSDGSTDSGSAGSSDGGFSGGGGGTVLSN